MSMGSSFVPKGLVEALSQHYDPQFYTMDGLVITPPGSRRAALLLVNLDLCLFVEVGDDVWKMVTFQRAGKHAEWVSGLCAACECRPRCGEID